MIPKTIHYCWFGRNPLPKSVVICIDSWKRFCPDYEIKMWTEDNYSISSHPYIQEAYEAKRWAFVSDLARLLIVYENGGVYLDTDVELIKSLDNIVENNAFFYGIEKDTNIRTGEEFIHVATGLGFGAEAGNNTVKALIDEYEGVHFKSHEGIYDLTPCPVRNSRALTKLGFDIKDELIEKDGGTIYPADFFCPEEFSSEIKRYTENTVSIHHYDSSWKTDSERMKDKLRNIIRRIIH